MPSDHRTGRDGGSAAERAATRLVRAVVDAGLDGVGPLDPAAAVADAARRRHGAVADAVDEVVRSHSRVAAANGFVTGLGGFLTLPVALPANVAGFYAVATRMVGAIAHLHGHDLGREEVRTAVLLVLVGADADPILARAGFSPVGRAAALATSRLPAPALMVLNKGIGFRMLSQVGRATLPRLGRGLPLAGGVVGAGLDVWLLRRVAGAARAEFAVPALPGAPA